MGALAFARHSQSAREFSNQLSARAVEKTYLALVISDTSAFPEQRSMIETELECRNGWMRVPGAEGVYERDCSALRSSRERGEDCIRKAVNVGESTK